MELFHIDYLHELSLALTESLLAAIKKKELSWGEFEAAFRDLLQERKVETKMVEWLGDGVPCFLCSEDKPHHCHRKLVVEYFQEFKEANESAARWLLSRGRSAFQRNKL